MIEITTLTWIIIAVLVAGGLIQAGLKILTVFLSTRTGPGVNLILQIVSSLAGQVVQAINQTIVDDIKAKAKDGKLTKEEQKEILEAALSDLKKILPASIKSALEKLYGKNVDDVLKTAIEAKVKELKQAKTVTRRKK